MYTFYITHYRTYILESGDVNGVTERFVRNIYNSLKFTDASQLSIVNICETLSIDVCFWGHSSSLAIYNEKTKLFIDERINEQQQWQEFGHEMQHYFLDHESQLYLNSIYKNYQERKSDYFAYHFCVPTFMLMELKGITVYRVMELFNVEFDFALRRLEMYKNKIITRG